MSLIFDDEQDDEVLAPSAPLSTLFSGDPASNSSFKYEKRKPPPSAPPKPENRVYVVNIYALEDNGHYRPVGKGGLTLLAAKTIVLYRSKREGPLAAVTLQSQTQLEVKVRFVV